MKKIRSLILALGLILAFVLPVATATPVAASPGQHATNCTVIGGTASTSVNCTAYNYVAGYTGIYQAFVTCWVGSTPHTYYGPWRTIDSTSTAVCIQGAAHSMPSSDHGVIKA